MRIHRTATNRRRVRGAFLVASASVLAVTGASWATIAPASAAPAESPVTSGSSQLAPLFKVEPLRHAPGITAPVLRCQEDEPCWRVWYGDGNWGPDAPPYMFLPESVTDPVILAQFGYKADR